MHEFREVLEHFDVVSSGNGEHQIRCPAHEDRQPSMVARVSDDGEKLLLHCRAGCSNEAILEAVGVQMSALFAPDDEGTAPRVKPRVVKQYPYHDENGDEVFQVVRMEPKSFRQRHRETPDGNWCWSMDGVRRVLFNLPAILDQPSWPVVVCEGEKDCLRVIATGAKVVPTTNAGGAGKWRDEYSMSLTGRRVAIVPDNDSAGKKHAQAVIGSLILHGVASVRVVQLPADVKDVSDYLDGHEAAEFVNLMKGSQEWKPRQS